MNNNLLLLSPLEFMQFRHALDKMLRELVLADPALGPVQLLTLDISNGFYRVNLNINNVPKLGVAFYAKLGEPKLVAFSLVLPMGWKNTPPVFSAAIETIADLDNHRIKGDFPPPTHTLIKRRRRWRQDTRPTVRM